MEIQEYFDMTDADTALLVSESLEELALALPFIKSAYLGKKFRLIGDDDSRCNDKPFMDTLYTLIRHGVKYHESGPGYYVTGVYGLRAGWFVYGVGSSGQSAMAILFSDEG